MMEPERDTDAALVGRFVGIADTVNADADLRRRGRWLTANILVGIGGKQVHLSITSGQITGIDSGSGLMRPWRFAVRGTNHAWGEFWRPVPAAGWHDLFALSKRGALVMEGDLQPLIANLQYIKDVLAMPRHMGVQ